VEVVEEVMLNPALTFPPLPPNQAVQVDLVVVDGMVVVAVDLALRDKVIMVAIAQEAALPLHFAVVAAEVLGP
jgi:hypothetical protein